MDAVDFLDSDFADLPKTRVGDYPSFMDHILSEYLQQIQQVRGNSDIDRFVRNEAQQVAALSDAIRDVIRLATSGDQTAAYGRLDATLGQLGARLRVLMPSGDMSQHVNPLYRFRTPYSTAYHKGSLFHIPFYLRRIVGPMRYSVAGLPSLYLGGSTEACWRELGRPDLGTVSVSRFHAAPNTNLRVLNFGHRLPLLAAYIKTVPGDFVGPSNAAAFVKAQVACWPLVAACSIRVPNRAVLERPEYLVPQLMLNWITRTHQFHGIRYFSTHYSEYLDDPKIYMNYVFPARTSPIVGYCQELCDLFELAEPVSWAEAKGSPAAGGSRPRYKTRGVLDPALEAEFGRAEDGLLGMPTSRLTSVPEQLLADIRSAVQERAFRKWWSEKIHERDWAHWFQAKSDLGLPDDLMI